MKNSVLLRSLTALGILGSGFAAAPIDEIRIERPRPMGALAGELAERYGYLVTYEDAPVDLREVVVERRPNGIEYRYPTWRPITFHVQARIATEGAGAESQGGATAQLEPLGPKIIDPLVAEYNSSGNPGKFTVIYEGDYAHIIPAVPTREGRAADFEPILSTIVPSYRERGTCWELFTGLIDDIQRARGVKINVVTVPVTPMDPKQCSLDGHWLPARQVLVQLLDGMGKRPPFSDVRSAWGLVYDPTIDAYFLDARPVWNYHPPAVKLVPDAQPRLGGSRSGLPLAANSSARKSLAPASPGQRAVADGLGTILLETSPHGGVFVDDQFYGITPITLTLKPGKHTIRVKASGYKDWRAEVLPGAGTESHLNAALEKSN